MPDPRNETDWLAKVPLWFKAGVGFMGTIATIVGFIVAWRENAPLFILVTLAMLLGGVFLVSLYVFIARRKTKSKKTPGAYRYEKIRPLGLLGMLAVCLVLAAPYFIKPMGALVSNALRGSPTPIPSFTPSPTLTPVPTPTPTPTFTSIPPARVEDPDVWIAEFEVDDSVANLMTEHRIESALGEELEQFQGQKITVRVDGPPIQMFSQAQDILNNGRTRVVIWGKYNEHGAVVRMLLSGATKDDNLQPVTVIDILPEGKAPETEVTFTIEDIMQDIVPGNVSFMSLFVIGHLAYLSHNYRTGHEAFDAAMTHIPDDVVIENEAILSFFRARDLHKKEPPDLPGAICAYVNAIQADRESGVVAVSDVAYNNLGLVISRFYGSSRVLPATPETPVPLEAASCLQQLGLLANEYQDPKILFQRALDINPNLTLARYNKIVFAWLQTQDRSSDESKAAIRSQLESIEMEDESIVGTYILRAVLYDETGEDGEALQMYLRGINQAPEIPLLHFHVGQLYLSDANNLPEAEKHLRAAVFLNSAYQEARLALANLYYRSERLAEATQQLEAILVPVDTAPASGPLFEALILRSGIAMKQADIPGAREYLNQATRLDSSDPFLHVLLGLLYQFEGRMEEAALSFDTAAGLHKTPSTGTWARFVGACFWNGVLPIPFADWMRDQLPSSTCLGRDLNDRDERLRAFYDLFSDGLLQRRDPALFALLGAQCPYVYTQNLFTGEWEFQTTILYQVMNHESAQIRPLAQFNGRLLIREVEPEISYLNRLYVLAEMADGSFQTLAPDVEELKREDGEYIMLHQGEEILVALDGYPVNGNVRQWWVMAVGYYAPLY